MKITDENVKNIAENISNWLYADNLQATRELIELFNNISTKPLLTVDDYVKFYDDWFYTFRTWEQLVEEEKKQVDGLTECELKEQIGKSVWQLPCGWYVQCI